MKKNIISAALVVLSSCAIAQQLPLYSQYTALPYLYNPSLAGQGESVNAGLLHRSQWTGIAGAPTTSLFTMDGPIAVKNIGLAGTIFNDVTDITSRIGFYTSYSYKLKINEDQKVLFGLSMGVMQQRIDLSRAVIKDANDPYLMYPTNLRKMIFDATLGVTYCWKTLQVGLSVPQLLGNKVDYVNTKSNLYYTMARSYVFNVKYTFDVNKDKGMTVYPLVLMRYAPGAPVQYDINAVFDWKKFGWAALTYRSNYAVGVNIGFRLNNTLRAGYAYDFTVNTIKNYAGGAHEIFLGYTFGGGKDNIDLGANSAKTDSIIAALQATGDKQKEDINKSKADIERLNEEVNKLKARQDSMKTAVVPTATTTPVVDVQKANVNDFKTENGQDIPKGFYVVVGAFKNLANAEKVRTEHLAKYPETTILFNKQKGLHYVSILKSDAEEVAKEVEIIVSKKNPGTWVFDMQ
ncbi:MAG: PorP/SprF family type IX secretion system membrane protein [Bacteroidia bacterium]